MAIHIGKKIKEEVYRQRIPITDFAKRISRSRNVVYNIFERASVDTLLLNKIGRVLNCDFFSVYSAQKEYSQEGIKSFNFNDPEVNYLKSSEEISLLKQQVELLTNQNDYYKKLIDQLIEQKKPAKKAARKK